MIAWLQPAALIGLLALAGPILIHLLRRQRAPRVLFPSLRFVRPTRTAAVRLRVPSGPFVDAIVFRHLDQRDPTVVRAGDAVELAYRVGLDDYGGTSRIQLVAEWLGTPGAPGPHA